MASYLYDIVDNKMCNQRCGVCMHDDFVYMQAEAEFCCRNCGTVMESRLMVDDSVNLYAPEDGGVNPNLRHGGPVVEYLPQASLSTRTGNGGKMDASTRRALQNNSMPSRERTLYKKFKELDRILTALRIDSQVVTNWADRIWADLRECSVMAKGENNRALMASCVHYACKVSNFKRTPDEIMQAAELTNESKFHAEGKRIIDALAMAKCSYFADLVKEEETDVDVPRYVGKLYATPHWPLVRQARKVLEAMDDRHQMVNSQEATRIAVAIFIGASQLDGVCMPLLVRHCNEATRAPGPPQRTPITLDMLYVVFGVRPPTLQKNIQAVADNIPGMATPRLAEALALKVKPPAKQQQQDAHEQQGTTRRVPPVKVHKLNAPLGVSGGGVAVKAGHR